MPPKKNGDDAAGPCDNTIAGAVTVLCHLIMSCDEFKADSKKLASILGMTTGKNVPRKINSIINPYGFELKGGKMISQDGAAGPSDNTSAAEDGKDDKMKKAPEAPKPKPKAKPTPKARLAPAPTKKRKLAVSFPDEDDSDHVKEEDDQED